MTGLEFASTVVFALSAWSAMEDECVCTENGERTARSAAGRRFASTRVCAPSARSAEDKLRDDKTIFGRHNIENEVYDLA